MSKIQFNTTIQRFGAQGEKTGWTYIEIPGDLANQLKPGNRKEFKVKGKLDNCSISRQSVMPIGGGKFIMPLNADLRKKLGKKHGAMLEVNLQADNSAFVFNKDLMECLDDAPEAKRFFQTLTGSHQRYFSKWIDGAKTDETRVKRIARALNALAKKWGYPEMMRDSQGRK